MSQQYSWTCVACRRNVPNRFGTCRCGAVRDTGAAGTLGASGDAGRTGGEALGLAIGSIGDSRAEVGDAVPTNRSSALAWIALGFFALVGAGTLLALQVIPVRPPSQTAGSASIFPAESRVVSSELNTFEPGAPAAPGAPAVAPTPPTEPAPAAPVPPIAVTAPVTALEDVISRAIPAIVAIEAGHGRGSGFFAAPGTIITNRHVIQDSVSVTVRLSNGQSLPGRVARSSTEFDLAVVRVDSALPSQAVLPLGTVNDVRPGQEVIAIGLALGVFQNSVTRGIISAVRRADRTVMLQTDAAINPGSSGGPLLNRYGQVVGINTLKVGGSAESLGFAVAVDHAGALLGRATPAGPFAPSAQQSQQLAPAFGARSSTDLAREEGARRYGLIVEAVARQAVQLDTYWSRIKANCTVRVAPGHDREWFGLWDGRAGLETPDPSCASALQELGGMAAQVRSTMATADEDARRASVLPGQLRDIRRRYRMDWAGWEIGGGHR